MRARSRRSLHIEDLPTILSRCKEAGAHGYLTLNTLTYDQDLKLCHKLLKLPSRIRSTSASAGTTSSSEWHRYPYGKLDRSHEIQTYHPQKKPECIGCGLCTEVAPGYWHMDEDGETKLNQISRSDAQSEYADGFVEDREVLLQAEEGCPESIIRIQ